MTQLVLNSHAVITEHGYTIVPVIQREYGRVIVGFRVTTDTGFTQDVALVSDGTALDRAAEQIDVVNGAALVARLTVADPAVA